MPVDLEYLRRHYASLSDEGLVAIHRADLVAAAQKVYDDEVSRRDLSSHQRSPRRREAAEVDAPAPNASDPENPTDAPEWLDDAAEVYSAHAKRGAMPPDDALMARDALDAAGVPNHLDLYEIPGEDDSRWRLMVPGDLNLHASSVLERDLSNGDFEAGWRANLEAFSDGELRSLDVEAYFCGLFDRVERVHAAYEDELAKRRLKR